MGMVHDESSLHMAISLQSGASHSVLILWSRGRARSLSFLVSCGVWLSFIDLIEIESHDVLRPVGLRIENIVFEKMLDQDHR